MLSQQYSFKSPQLLARFEQRFSKDRKIKPRGITDFVVLKSRGTIISIYGALALHSISEEALSAAKMPTAATKFFGTSKQYLRFFRPVKLFRSNRYTIDVMYVENLLRTPYIYLQHVLAPSGFIEMGRISTRFPYYLSQIRSNKIYRILMR